jgi:4'-phosphopantetheinyl transferase
LGSDECQVWWASLADCADWQARLLDPVEQERAGRYLRAADRNRFTLGVALTRLALAAQLGVDPPGVPLSRICARCGGPHGRPRLDPSAPFDFSLSHSGDLIALAIIGAEPGSRRSVGVDVEELGARVVGLPVESVLSAAEATAFDQLSRPDQTMAFYRYWVRKEAVLKATGDGLRVPMTHLTMSGPDQPPRLAQWRGRPGFAEHVAVHDLPVKPGYAAALAFIGGDAVVTCHDSAALLRPPRPPTGAKPGR